MANISKIWSREILDSRGIPTIEAVCQIDTGQTAIVSIPSGTSTGTHEALEIRDIHSSRYLGKGVLEAIKNINEVIGPALVGMNVSEQELIDRKMIEMDGTPNKINLGSNSILAISEAVTKAAAIANNMPLFSWINNLAQKQGLKPTIHIPAPIFNMINGGLHGAGNLDFQEFHVIPATSKKYSDALREGVEIYMTIGMNLERRGAIKSIGNEGGYAPNLFTNADALEIIVESIKETNYQIGRDVFLGLDIASSVFYKNGEYVIRDLEFPQKDDGLIEFYRNLNSQYHLAILEDVFHEDAWESWKKFYSIYKGQFIIVGDDFLATNPERVQRAIKEKACDAVLIKPNQIGTITETIEVIKLARSANWKVIVSHRSGETNDYFIADFAVGMGADYAKFGAPARGERVAKYNRLLGIEMELQNT